MPARRSSSWRTAACSIACIAPPRASTRCPAHLAAGQRGDQPLLHTDSGLTLVGWNDTSHLEDAGPRRELTGCRTPRSSSSQRRSFSRSSRSSSSWAGAAASHVSWADTLNSIGLGMLSQVVGVFTKLFTSASTLGLRARRLFELSRRSPWVWIGALLAYDFLYYWLHRAGHTVALFWAAHVVHHQSEEYNLSTALRQTGSAGSRAGCSTCRWRCAACRRSSSRSSR
jgi:hypothetical protein